MPRSLALPHRGGTLQSPAGGRDTLEGTKDRLAWGPTHEAASHQMEVQVMNALPGLGTGVDRQAIAIFADLPLLCDTIGDFKHLHEQSIVVRSEIAHRRDMLFRDHQYMDWCDGADILEGKHVLVSEDLL